jgi:hypothetical protein
MNLNDRWAISLGQKIETVEKTGIVPFQRSRAWWRWLRHSSADDGGGCQGFICSASTSRDDGGSAGSEARSLVMTEYNFKRFQEETEMAARAERAAAPQIMPPGSPITIQSSDCARCLNQKSPIPADRAECWSERKGTKPAMHSNLKPATCSDPKPAGVPI